ncbi:MAG: hypothetical protein K2X01_05180 [Cyanobacteria bacterium]|nr:hypothetical protein [Cyanobacteriota bacterium]
MKMLLQLNSPQFSALYLDQIRPGRAYSLFADKPLAIGQELFVIQEVRGTPRTNENGHLEQDVVADTFRCESDNALTRTFQREPKTIVFTNHAERPNNPLLDGDWFLYGVVADNSRSNQRLIADHY